ncbi:MAG TPA: PEP-CTERM sorting domain-containing protein [Casimicrobiaceae bacterium]|nr:PEP-CTERM sorting domain-containing protein [Casimicrobiaceae bacterium]
MRRLPFVAPVGLAFVLAASASLATPFVFRTGNPDGLMATASQPASAGKTEIESADDFLTTSTTSITGGSFTGLLTGGAAISAIGDITVEIYRVFPLDSDTARTPNVTTRTNSPSDVAFDDRDSAAGELSFTCSTLSGSFTAANSVLNGINKAPNQTTGGEGAVTGNEVQCSVTFTTPFVLPADHYFFVPQVAVSGDGNFFWLSAPRPIVAPGTPFGPDLQSWIRNTGLDPDWSRIGTDIVGGSPAPTFNATFSLVGETVPEPAMLALLLAAALAGGIATAKPARRGQAA